jgi:hypothetical protein
VSELLACKSGAMSGAGGRSDHQVQVVTQSEAWIVGVPFAKPGFKLARQRRASLTTYCTASP